MTKITPGWSDGVKPATQVESAAPKGNPVRETPRFVPVSPPGKPAAPSIKR